jgi:hypothetical protein
MKQIAQFNSGANLSCRGGLRMNDAILIVLDARRSIKFEAVRVTTALFFNVIMKNKKKKTKRTHR